jgi:hypothetical protein
VETLVELGFAGFGTELGAHFAGGVVKQQFVVLATLMFFGFDAGQRLVGWQRPGTAKGRGGVAAVVQHADDDRAVDIAFDKVDQHFLTNARDELVTPPAPALGMATRSQQEDLSSRLAPLPGCSSARCQWNCTLMRPSSSVCTSSPSGPTTVAVCTPLDVGLAWVLLA